MSSQIGTKIIQLNRRLQMVNSNLRIPEELWNKLKKISYDEKRSINSQIIYIIEKYIEEQNKK